MQTRINGKPVTVEQDILLEQLIAGKKLLPERVVAEVNGQIIPREQWTTLSLRENDEIEIVSFVAGG